MSEGRCSCGQTEVRPMYAEGHGGLHCEAEPTIAETDAAVEAYIATMDPELRGGVVRDAVRRGMYPALIAAFSERAKR